MDGPEEIENAMGSCGETDRCAHSNSLIRVPPETWNISLQRVTPLSRHKKRNNSRYAKMLPFETHNAHLFLPL